MNLAKDIRDRERGGRAQVTVVEGDDEKSSEEAMKMMKEVLGDKREIRDAIPDEIVDEKLKTAIKLFQWVKFETVSLLRVLLHYCVEKYALHLKQSCVKSISDADGNLVVQEVAVKPLTQDLLKTEVWLTLTPHPKQFCIEANLIA